jgi:hypothetical protein
LDVLTIWSLEAGLSSAVSNPRVVAFDDSSLVGGVDDGSKLVSNVSSGNVVGINLGNVLTDIEGQLLLTRSPGSTSMSSVRELLVSSEVFDGELVNSVSSLASKCLSCPADYVQHPQTAKDCIYGKYVKQVRCKRGYRVDQLSVENFAGDKKLSHGGHAGGAWRSGKQELTLDVGEHITKVDAYHITRGHVRNQLASIVYATNKRRVVKCYYSRVRYSTAKASFKAPDGEYIQMIHQYEDKRKCCGRVTSVDTAKFAPTKDEALNSALAAKCKAN